MSTLPSSAESLENQVRPVAQPITLDLKLAYASSLIIALLAALASVIGLATLFSLMNLSNIISTLSNQTSNSVLESPLWIADLAIVAPAWLIGGVLLWRRNPLGYVACTGLLLQGSMLFIGAIFALAFPALYTASPIDVTGIAFILVTSLITLIPFALFVRGIVRSDKILSSA